MIYLLDIINVCCAEKNTVIGSLTITVLGQPVYHPDEVVLEITAAPIRELQAAVAACRFCS